MNKPTRVLGIDVASRAWSVIGAALLEFDRAGFTRVVPGALTWPTEPARPTAALIAAAVDRFARENDVAAIGLDGPHAWRDPDTPPDLPGVGRRGEYQCRAQAKTGVYPRTYPQNQRGWIELSITLFDELLRTPGVHLAGDAWETDGHDGAGGYAILECSPTSIWRASGLKPLPGKRPIPLEPYIASLSAAYALPPFETTSHDDLQAVVAALAAAAVCGGPARAIRLGVAHRMVRDEMGARRVEGFIWDAAPLPRANRADPGEERAPASAPRS